jgi:hypothetical protein
MKYKEINPVLTTEMLKSCGFIFDGFYYVNPDCVIRFNPEGDGFKPSYTEEGAPRFQVVIKTYSELIKLMHSALQLFLQKQVMNKNFTTDREAQEFVVMELHRYYSFDKELNFSIQFAPGGIMPMANNEYTYSLLDGDIRNFTMFWKLTPDEVEFRQLEFQTNPQCVSYPFLLQLIVAENPELRESETIPIISEVQLHSNDGYVPFFGVGIPKLMRRGN